MLFSNPVSGPIHIAGQVAKPGEFRLTQDFGPSSIAAEPTVKWPGGEGIPKGTYVNFHQGIDLGNGRCGSDVIAAKAGRIDFAGIDGTGSRTVIVNHGGGFRTWYAHLADDVVKKGQAVKAAQLLGHVGNTGASTACHLHFAVENSADGKGAFSFLDPWRRLTQNVRVHPDGASVNLRTAANLGNTKYAQSKPDGKVHRLADDVVIAATNDWQPWLGTVSGAAYEGRTDWQTLRLDGHVLYIAAKYAVLSQT